jgi:hypothetical protein
MIERAVSGGLITGLGEKKIEGGVAIQYADDTLLLM